MKLPLAIIAVGAWLTAQAAPTAMSTIQLEVRASTNELTAMALASRFRYGLGGEVPDPSRAIRWLRHSIATWTNQQAQLELSRCHRIGFGVPANQDLADKILIKLACEGYPEAQYDLGVQLHWSAMNDTMHAHAYKWLMLARQDESMRPTADHILRNASTANYLAAAELARNFTPVRRTTNLTLVAK